MSHNRAPIIFFAALLVLVSAPASALSAAEYALAGQRVSQNANNEGCTGQVLASLYIKRQLQTLGNPSAFVGYVDGLCEGIYG